MSYTKKDDNTTKINEQEGAVQFFKNETISSGVNQTNEAENSHVESKQESVENHHGESHFGLQRTLNLTGAISFNLGTMIGSGIFVSPKGVLENTGSVGLSLVMWTFTGIIAFLGSLCFAELGTLIGKSAGEFVYLNEAYGGGIAYMFQFVNMFVTKPSSMAITAMTCSEYILALVFRDGCVGAPNIIVKLLAIVIVWIIVYLNSSSIDAGKGVQVIFTIAKVGALFVIILGGLVKLGQGNTQYFQNSFEGSNWNFTSIILSFFSAYYAYNGWQLVNVISEEIINPKRNVPRALMLAVSTATVLYVMTNVSYFTVLSPEEMLASDTIAISWAQYVIPRFAWLMPITVAVSCFGGINGNTFVLGRYIYRSSRDGHLPQVFSFVHVARMTPFPAYLLEGLIVSIYVLPADVQTLLDMLGFIVWTINGLVFGGLIILRFKKPDSDPRYKRTFKCPIIIAILMTIVATLFVLTPIIMDPQVYYFYGLIIFFGCLVFYFPFVHFGKRIPGMDTFTKNCQLFLTSAPSEIHVE